MAIKKSELYSSLWASCDELRGGMDPSQYKDYILVMLFLKYISDLWQEHVEAYRQQFAGDEARIRRRLERERFVLPEGASFYDLFERRNEANIGELINIALEKIEDNTYGVCDSCGTEINANRLDALPWASLCLNCQDRLEGR